MTLGQLLQDDQIIPALNARDRWDAIRELSEHLFASDRLREAQRECISTRLHEREVRMTTGIGAGVAIPHALCPQTDCIVAALGISRMGIDFEAVDGQPVHIVVLFVVPENRYQLRLETLSAIGKSLSNPDLRRRLLAANSIAEIKLVLSGRPDSKAARAKIMGLSQAPAV